MAMPVPVRCKYPVGADMQTIITTTHISGFKSEWLEGALFLSVEDGQIKSEQK
jgi:recombinational DNA repair ATPase RecF